jgi:hypothetical protein
MERDSPYFMPFLPEEFNPALAQQMSLVRAESTKSLFMSCLLDYRDIHAQRI